MPVAPPYVASTNSTRKRAVSLMFSLSQGGVGMVIGSSCSTMSPGVGACARGAVSVTTSPAIERTVPCCPPTRMVALFHPRAPYPLDRPNVVVVGAGTAATTSDQAMLCADGDGLSNPAVYEK